MSFLIPLGALFIGLAIGSGAAYFYLHGKSRQLIEVAQSHAEAEQAAVVERATNLKISLDRKDADLNEAQRKLTIFANREGQLIATIKAERKQAQQQMALVNAAEQRLTSVFKALSADALRSNNQSFLDLAKSNLEKLQETAKGELAQRQQAIDQLVKPVSESLQRVDQKIQELEKVRAGAYAGLTEQVKSLLESQREIRLETSNLVRALRTPTVRGRWGEIQLRRVVELAGMLAHCDFTEQHSVDSDEGRVRPDLVVHLPSSRNIVVDAKVPLAAYLEALEATDDETRGAKLDDHARQVRVHLAALGKKSYFERFESSPEFVVLFLPGEAFFFAAIQRDPSLIEFGVDHNVIVATPTTLIGLLRAVAYGWRQEQLAENANEIRELGKELYKRCSDFGSHMANVGRNLTKASQAYNQAVGSMESRLLVTARRFADLGAVTADSKIEVLTPVEIPLREVQAAELVAEPSATQENGRLAQ